VGGANARVVHRTVEEGKHILRSGDHANTLDIRRRGRKALCIIEIIELGKKEDPANHSLIATTSGRAGRGMFPPGKHLQVPHSTKREGKGKKKARWSATPHPRTGIGRKKKNMGTLPSIRIGENKGRGRKREGFPQREGGDRTIKTTFSGEISKKPVTGEGGKERYSSLEAKGKVVVLLQDRIAEG